MKVTFFDEKTNDPIVLCLGSFDSIHKGHQKIINFANEIKLKYNAKSAVFTYANDLGLIPGKKGGLVFTYEERLLRLQEFCVDEVCVAKFTKDFADLSPKEFLSKLCDNRAIGALICGNDFKFGKNATGDTTFLKEFCLAKKIPLYVCDFELDDFGNKISTSTIKELLAKGDICKVNKLLGKDYFVTGVVEKGREVGRTLGFPTANISLPKEKFLLKSGVYATYVFINGKKYNALTNVGTAPTFSINKYLIEAHVLGFNGDLYGEKLTVYFTSFIRDIKKFDSKEQLISQLESDLRKIV